MAVTKIQRKYREIDFGGVGREAKAEEDRENVKVSKFFIPGNLKEGRKSVVITIIDKGDGSEPIVIRRPLREEGEMATEAKEMQLVYEEDVYRRPEVRVREHRREVH